ncbi:MAG: DUF2285 domain-containing protein [Pseudomonadota bacterium]
MPDYDRSDEDRQFDLRNYEYLRTLSKPAYAWEFTRRNRDFIEDARYCRDFIPTPRLVAPNTLLCRMVDRCLFAEKWGLYILPQPSRSAVDIPPFWLPETLRSTTGIRLVRTRRIDNQPLDLSRFPGRKHVLIPDMGPPELVAHGPHYAGYFQISGDWKLLPRRFYLQLQIGLSTRFDAQMEAADALYLLIEGPSPAPWRERAYGPNRLRRALIAYDIRTKFGGSHWDAARAIFGGKRVDNARLRHDDSLQQRARRSFTTAQRLVDGGYRALLR